MARYKMSPERLIKRMLNNYADCIVVDNGIVDYEESCYRMAVKIMETMPPTQQESVFVAPFEDEQDCYDYIVKKIPGLCEGMIEFAEENDLC